MKCPKCGAEYNTIYVRCPDCGEDLVEEGIFGQPAPQRQVTRSGPVLKHGRILVAILAVLLTIEATYWIVRFLRDPTLSSKLSDFNWFPIALLILVLTLVVNWINGKRCPKCTRRWGLKRTGAAENRADQGDFVFEQWRCRYCGHVEWIPAMPAPFAE